MIYLLFDNPGDKGKVSFISQFIHGEVKESDDRQSLLSHAGW